MAIILNDNLKINAGKPVDSKYLTTGNTVYTSTGETNLAISVPERYTGLTVNVLGEEWWYKEGVSDTDLIPKFSSTTSDGTITGATNIGFFSGASDVQILDINTFIGLGSNHLDYRGNYFSLYNYYYIDDKNIIRIGVPSDGISKRAYVKTVPPVKSFIWGEYGVTGWHLVDNNVDLFIGSEPENTVNYYGSGAIFIETGWTNNESYTISGNTISINDVSINPQTTGSTCVIGGPVYSKTIYGGTTLEFRTIRSTTPNTLCVQFDDAFINVGTIANNYVTDARNGLYVTGLTKTINTSEYVVRLGGCLTEPTVITLTGSTSLSFTDNRTTTSGITYYDDYESGFQPRTLVTKQYVDGVITGGSLIKSVCILPTTYQAYTVKEGDFFIGARSCEIPSPNYQTINLPLPESTIAGTVIVVADYDGYASTNNILIAGTTVGHPNAGIIDNDFGSQTYINNGSSWSVIAFAPALA